MENRRKKMMTTAIAGAMAATIAVGGGTFAYLQGQTNTVENQFNPNEVVVDIEETTGNQYSIVPGESDPKDPTLKITNTLPSFLFATIVDNTDGLVQYEVADGWKALEGYDKVYYRIVDPVLDAQGNATEQTFGVLKDNKVDYSAALTNADMVDAQGHLRDSVTLSFKGFGIQMEPFYTNAINAGKTEMDAAKSAYVQEPITVSVSSSGDLKQMIDDNNQSDRAAPLTIELNDDLSYTEEELTVEKGKEVIIDLNGHDLNVQNDSNDGLIVTGGGTLTLTNSGDGGSYNFTSSNPNCDTIFVYNAEDDQTTTLNFDSVEVNVYADQQNSVHAYAPKGDAVINITDGTVINVTGQEKQVAGVVVGTGSTVNMDGGIINVNVVGTDANADAVGILLFDDNKNTKRAVLNLSGGTINVIGGGTFAQGIQAGYDYGNDTVNMTGGIINVSGKDAAAFGIAKKADINITGGSINVGVDDGYEGYAFIFQYPSNTNDGIVNVKDGVVNLQGTNNVLTNGSERVNVIS